MARLAVSYKNVDDYCITYNYVASLAFCFFLGDFGLRLQGFKSAYLILLYLAGLCLFTL